MRSKKVLVLMLAITLVVGFAYSEGKSEKEVPVGSTAMPGTPQYGGTLNVALAQRVIGHDPPSPDIADGYRDQLDWLQPVMENPVCGDFVKYGPRGTNEFPFQMRGNNPLIFLRGQLLTSWELTDEAAVWHVRPGIMWQGRDVMESREFVAEDIAAWLRYFRDAPPGKGFSAMTTAAIRATDKYTVEIPFAAGYNYYVMYIVGYEDRALVSPPELQGNKSWDDQVGTGPFMIKEYVIGSHMTYESNPIWNQTATIDGKEYELPFVDEMTIPIIPDEATTISALRTGKFDWIERVNVSWWADLDRTAPEMESRKSIGAGGYQVTFRNDVAPFNNVNVRRALMIGTDKERFVDLLGIGEMPIDWFPFYPLDSSVYIPLEKLSENIKILYTYDPELAKKMLADEGFPNGFKMELNSRPEPNFQDMAALVKDQWTKIGVDAEIKVYDAATTWEMALSSSFKHAATGEWEGADAVSSLLRTYETGTDLNYPNYSNPKVDPIIDQIKEERDLSERIRLAKEAYEIIRYECPEVTLAPKVVGHYWWPWIKNYYGEANVGDWGNPWPILAHVWLDLDMKAEMGY